MVGSELCWIIERQLRLPLVCQVVSWSQTNPKYFLQHNDLQTTSTPENVSPLC